MSNCVHPVRYDGNCPDGEFPFPLAHYIHLIKSDAKLEGQRTVVLFQGKDQKTRITDGECHCLSVYLLSDWSWLTDSFSVTIDIDRNSATKTDWLAYHHLIRNRKPSRRPCPHAFKVASHLVKKITVFCCSGFLNIYNVAVNKKILVELYIVQQLFLTFSFSQSLLQLPS